MERLEREQRNLHDQHNTLDERVNVDEYVRIIKANASRFKMRPSMSLQEISSQLLYIVETAAEKNIKTHINCKGGCWYTHLDKNGYGCFMCEDLYLSKYLHSIIQYLASKYPSSRPLESLYT